MSQMGGAFVTSVPAIPVGSMQAFAGSSAPTGWLLCNGTTASRTTYSNLFSVIGTTYGVGDGSTTFGLPDMRGRVPMGAGTGNQQNASGSGVITGGTAMTPRTAGAFGGEETHLLSSAEIPAHSHPVSDPGHNHGAIATAGGGGGATVAGWTVGGASAANATNFAYTGSSTTGLTVSNNTGGGGRHAVVPPFVVLNYIIKAIPDTPRGGMTATFTPPIVTSLPLVPQFGDQVVYAADATNGVYWLLQYDASGTYPWKFVGGAPLLNSNSNYPASQSTSSYTNITSGPSVTPVLSGDYTVRHWGQMDIINPVRELLFLLSTATSSVAASDEGAANVGSPATYTGYSRTSWYAERLMSAIPANEAITIQQKYAVGVQTAVFHKCGIEVTPRRVKAA